MGKIMHVTVGQLIQFGNYDWRVLDRRDGKALIITEEIIEQRPYNKNDERVTWETCSLREYLNTEFLKEFTSEQRERIIVTTNQNPNNPWYDTVGGDDTHDHIFLLSLENVVKYFGDSGDLRNKKRYGVGTSGFVLASDGFLLRDQYDNVRIAKDAAGAASWWWLRSPGNDSYNAARVDDVGFVNVYGCNVNTGYIGVRPALWLNL